MEAFEDHHGWPQSYPLMENMLVYLNLRSISSGVTEKRLEMDVDWKPQSDHDLCLPFAP